MWAILCLALSFALSRSWRGSQYPLKLSFAVCCCWVILSLILFEKGYLLPVGSAIAFGVASPIAAFSLTGVLVVVQQRLQVLALLDQSEERSMYAEAQLLRQEFLDSLTNLPNRPSFLEKLKRVVEASGDGSFAVIYLDLDRFKTINDASRKVRYI